MKADNNHNMKSLAMGGEFTGHHTRSQGPPEYTEMAADNSPPVHECSNKPGEQTPSNDIVASTAAMSMPHQLNQDFHHFHNFRSTKAHS